MLQAVEETNPTSRSLKIEIPTAVVEQELAKMYQQLRTSVNIPGFRKGKVPRSMLEKRFSKTVEAEVVGKLIPEFYAEAVKEAGIIPVSQPNIEGEVEIEKNQPLSFSITVEIKPDVKDLNYEGLELDEIEVQLQEGEVEQALVNLHDQKASFEPSDDGAKDTDMAVIDFSAFIDDEPVEGLKEEDYQYVLGSETLPQEFKQELRDKKKGDTCEFTLSFGEDIQNKKVAGKTVLFKVAVKEVKNKVLPDLDDEFAKDLDYENMEELKNALSEQLLENHKKQRDEQYKSAVLKTLMDTHTIEAPPSMVKAEVDALVAQAKQMAVLHGAPQPDDKEFYAAYQVTAVNNVKVMLLLSSIGNAEGVEVTDEEIKARIAQLAQQTSMKSEDIVKMYMSQDGSLDGIKQQLYSEKVIDIVMSKVKIKEKSSLIV